MPLLWLEAEKRVDGFETLITDVLVIGGGGAGSRAAYEAKKADPRLKVTLVLDGRWGFSGSTCFFASEALGINAPLNMAEDGDSPCTFLQDILEAGLGLANPNLSERIAFESTERVLELVDLGVRFDLDGKKIRQKKLSGCSKARSLSQGGSTGVAIVKALKKTALKLGVEAIEGIRIIDLIAEEGEVVGAVGIHQGKVVQLFASAVILACGGAGRIFPHHVTPPSLHGDGFAMAYRAGAILTNMEFIQIGPGVIYPKMKFIIHSHIWNFHPILKNGLGKEFLEGYLPSGISKEEVLSLKSMSFPFSVRTAARYVDIAISKEIDAGRGSPHGGVFFDVTHVPEKALSTKSPITFQTFLKHGVNLAEDSIEIAPHVQSFNGGVKIDEEAATNIPGLFAVGEVSGGIHGADRPGGNNLADSQVFGYRGGRAAARFAAQRPIKSDERIPADHFILMKKPKEISEIEKAIGKALMVVRSEKRLKELLQRVNQFREEHPVIDIGTENFLLVTEMIARSALLRTESRGTHYREDYPETNPLFLKKTHVQKKVDQSMEVFLAD